MKRSGYSARIVIISILLLAAFIFLAVHLYKVQIIKHHELYEKAKGKYTAVKKVKGNRGEIYDKNGNLLVGNMPSINIRANPQLIGGESECKALAGYFSRKLNISSETVYRRLSVKKIKGRKMYEVVIKNNVSLDEAKEICREIKNRGIKGIYFYDSSERYYPKNELMSNILGFISHNNLKAVPVCGLELAYNSILSPIRAKASVYERARTGIPLSYGRQDMADVKPGKNIYLTILEPIQEIVEEELDKLILKWKPKAAYAVMVNPKTGSIMAMAQRPSFNPNDRSVMSADSWRNRIVSDGFEPGSTMKPLVIVKALALGVVKPDTVFDCENGYWVYGRRPLRDSHAYGDLTVTEIVQKSSNIGTAKISIELGEKKLYDLLCDYGFGKDTSLPFKHEATGILRKVKSWDSLSITRFPIGQGILVSPLQLVGAYTALANQGKRMRLKIIDKIVSPENENVYNYPTRIAKKVIKNKDAVKKIVDMMKLVTKAGGTAVNAAVPGYEVAGKTGTSQKWLNGEYSHSKYFSSFIGFVPADDPAFVLLVTVDEPHGSIYGGIVSAPAFSNIARKTLRYLDILPTHN